MADLKRIPGCHVYWGTAPLAAGLAKLPKEKVILFNIDTEAEPELKDVQSTKTPFDKERPTPLDSFDVIVKTLIDEGEKTQCVFNSKEELPATLGNFCLIFFFRYVLLYVSHFSLNNRKYKYCKVTNPVLISLVLSLSHLRIFKLEQHPVRR